MLAGVDIDSPAGAGSYDYPAQGWPLTIYKGRGFTHIPNTLVSIAGHSGCWFVKFIRRRGALLQFIGDGNSPAYPIHLFHSRGTLGAGSYIYCNLTYRNSHLRVNQCEINWSRASTLLQGSCLNPNSRRRLSMPHEQSECFGYTLLHFMA